MFWAQGGELVDAAGKPVFGDGRNRAAMLNLLGFLKRTIDTGASPGRVVNYRFEADLYPEILRGNVAMFLGGNWMAKQLRELGDKNDWGVAPIPLMAQGDPVTAAGGWTYAIFTPDAKKQDIIVDLINSLVAGPAAMTASTAAIGNLPTRMSVHRATPPTSRIRRCTTFWHCCAMRVRVRVPRSIPASPPSFRSRCRT